MKAEQLMTGAFDSLSVIQIAFLKTENIDYEIFETELLQFSRLG